MGRSVGVVALLHLNILIMETTLASWTEWGVEGEGDVSRETGGAEARKCLTDSGKVTVNLLCRYLGR